MSFNYTLPTTGALSFGDFIVVNDNEYLSDISEATAHRGLLRTLLKEAKRTEGPNRDYAKIRQAIEEYLPHLLGIVDCLEGGQLALKKEFESSWRCSLRDKGITEKRRVTCRGIYYELIFTLLTYGYVLSNWASTTIRNQMTKDQFDPKQATDFLCKAAGVFAHLAEEVIPRWTNAPAARPVDVYAETATSLSKVALADASSIVVRKALMQQTSSSLLGKLAIGVAGQYEMANGLVKSLSDASKLDSDWRKYITNGALFNQALGLKFLAKDASEHSQHGRAVGFVTEARRIFHQLAKQKTSTTAVHASQEVAEVDELYNNYKRMNDKVWFDEVPNKADLQTLTPQGRSALSATRHVQPAPAFGPNKGKVNGEGCPLKDYF